MRILYLDVDTLRPDHLGCYGYHRNTSPNIDRLAQEGTRCHNLHTPDAPCLPSRTALYTGRFGIHTGVVGHGGTAADMRLEGSPRGFADQLRPNSLPGFLKHRGLYTTCISPFGERHSAWHFYAGFREIHNDGHYGHASAHDVSPTALKWIKENAKKDDWYLHVNFWDPHTPYRAPEEYGNPFENDPIPEWLTEEVLEEHRQKVGPHSAHEVGMYTGDQNPKFPRQPGEIKEMSDLRRNIDGYDVGIRYADDHVGRVLNALSDEGVLDDTIIVFSSDHGENQGELGIYGEHATADQITSRIPFIVRGPGVKAGQVDNGLHYNLDWAPTLAEIMGKDAPQRWDGQSFAPTLTDGRDCGRDYLVLSQCCHVCQRSVRFGPWLYMRTYHDGYHLFPKEMLFNIETDPHEQFDVAKDNPALCQKAVYLLNEWHDDMMSSMDCEIDPLWTVMKEGGPEHARGHLKKYCERLKETGRGQHVEELMRRHPREFA